LGDLKIKEYGDMYRFFLKVKSMKRSINLSRTWNTKTWNKRKKYS